MMARELLGTAAVPDGGVLRLYRRGGDYSIMLGGNELMNSRLSGSEAALATLACARIAEVRAPAVLIGGLGLGFTLRAALAVLPADARVVVAELVPAVIGWARHELAALFAGSLDDPRVAIVAGDVAAEIARGGWDAILLDVDNGPDGLTRAGNDGLYTPAGLHAARQALRPGGVHALWSAHPAPRFTERLRAAGFQTETVPVRARAGGKGAHHMLWVSTPA